MATSQPQTNGTSATANTQATASSQQPTQTTAAPVAPLTPSPSEASTRPRDARLIELLLTSQGVTGYEQRVPLLLMDFAYRHTSSILTDALHLSGDPYVSQAGSKPSASAGAVASAPGEAAVTANAVRLAIGARLSYQFRGGSGGGGISKEYMQDLARDRNRVGLPRIAPSEWGIRLPSERFVLSGTSWGLKDRWDEADTSEDGDMAFNGEAMEGIEAPDMDDAGEEGVEGGSMEDVFGNEADADPDADPDEAMMED